MKLREPTCAHRGRATGSRLDPPSVSIMLRALVAGRSSYTCYIHLDYVFCRGADDRRMTQAGRGVRARLPPSRAISRSNPTKRLPLSRLCTGSRGTVRRRVVGEPSQETAMWASKKVAS